MDVMNATVTGYEVFRDILTLLLAITAVAGAVIYAVIYNRLSASLKNSVTLAADTELNKNIAIFLLALGYDNWIKFTHTKEDWRLDQAIELTKRALLHYANKLGEGERDNVWLICKLKNNLASFYAKKQSLTPDEKVRVQECAEYLYDKIDKYPKDDKERQEWASTFNDVKQRFSSTLKK